MSFGPASCLLTFGVGAIVDLPNMSVMVMGLDDWPVRHSTEIGEERLLLSVQETLGPQVKRLLTPPRAEESVSGQTNWFDEAHQIGVPVAPFPRWMVCSKCRLLAPINSGLFEPKTPPYRPDKACYVHNCTTQGRSPTVVPARFLVACEHGHLDDFPWLDFVHRGQDRLQGPLRMYELGVSGEAADVEVKCDKCGAVRRMAEAFGRDNEANLPPAEADIRICGPTTQRLRCGARDGHSSGGVQFLVPRHALGPVGAALHGQAGPIGRRQLGRRWTRRPAWRSCKRFGRSAN